MDEAKSGIVDWVGSPRQSSSVVLAGQTSHELTVIKAFFPLQFLIFPITRKKLLQGHFWRENVLFSSMRHADLGVMVEQAGYEALHGNQTLPNFAYNLQPTT